MEPSGPYAPPADLQSGATDSLADLDLSKLKPHERQFLEKACSKPNISWYMALWQVGIKMAATVYAVFSGMAVDIHWGWVAITTAGYLALGYWARTWSRLGTFLLLLFHVLFTYHLLFAASMNRKLAMGIPALIFFFGFMGAHAKVNLTRKARKDTLKPTVQPRALPTRAVRQSAKPQEE